MRADRDKRAAILQAEGVRQSEILRAEGIQVLVGPGEFEPHQPGTGGNLAAVFPWHVALAEVERRLNGGTAASGPSTA